MAFPFAGAFTGGGKYATSGGYEFSLRRENLSPSPLRAEAGRQTRDRERGEVQKPGGDRASIIVGSNNAPTTADLAEQQRFVLWWDGQEKAAGARGNDSNQYQVASQTNNATTLADLGLDRDTIHRWRKKLKAGRD